MQLEFNTPFLYILTSGLNLFIGSKMIYGGFWKKPGNIVFLFLIASVLLWIGSLHGIYVFAFQNFTALYLKFSIKAAYGASLLMPLFLFRFFYLFPSESFKLPKWLNLTVDAIPLVLAFLSIFTQLIFVQPIMQGNQYVADEFGPLYLFYILYFVFILLWIGFVGIHKVKNSQGIERKKTILILVSSWLFLFFPIISNAILPLWNIYIFQFEAPIFTIPFIFIFYAIIRYRFLDIKFTLSKTFKIIAAGIFSIFFAFIFDLFFRILFTNLELIYIHGAAFFTTFLIYPRILRLFNSKKFRRILGKINVEYFIDTIEEFRKENAGYKSLEQFKENLESTFCGKLHISFAEIVLINNATKRKFPELIRYCEQNPKLLVTKEVTFVEKDQKKKFPFSHELKKLGEVCLPLTLPSKALVGFLLLGEKPFHIPYTAEEIEALEGMQFQLSLELSAILYSDELRKAVKEKTKELEKQNKAISVLLSEKVKLLAQQSDFLALTAHELRTPLSLAILYAGQLTTYPSVQKNKDIQNDAEGVQRSLGKLKNLTEKLFEVLQYNLGKINISPEPTNLCEFIERIYEDFQLLMKEKNLTFILQNKLKRGLTVSLDPVYMRQLLQNYLTNAIKFSPTGEKIVLTAKETRTTFSFMVADNGEGVPDEGKQEIFKKFKSNHTMQSPGLGLGLYICKQIAKLHKGKAWVEDNPEGGAIFMVELPK